MVVKYATLKRPVGPSHASLPDRVTAELKEAIRSRQLLPGDRLVEERLAHDLGVSRNPVREAIRKLAAEGLVVITARRGAVVAGVSAQEARETIEVRALLEGHNARLAARRQDKRILQRIAAVLDKGTEAAASGRYDDLPALNVRFHQELASAGQNELLGEMLERLRAKTAMFFAPTEPGRQQGQWSEHAAILRAILDGDEGNAARLAANHVIGAVSEIDLTEPAKPTRRRAAKA
jgi:DNA-binding GntR family transcriptional regulator